MFGALHSSEPHSQPGESMAHVVGVDAGGTHTRAAAANLETGELTTGHAEGSNWTVHGPELCRERVERAVRAAVPPGARPSAVVICMAGHFPPDHARETGAWLAEAWPGTAAELLPDVVGAWAGALAGDAGVVAISGTGSICYGRNRGGMEARAGGWGPLFSDEGSAYAVGIAALKAVADGLDGLGPETALAGRFLERWPEPGADPQRWLRGIYRLGWNREQIAVLARAVVSAADAGDEVAASIVTAAAADVARLAGAVSRRLGGEALPFALQGGLGSTGAMRRAVRVALRQHAPMLTLTDAVFDPLDGALLLAAERAGGPEARRRMREALEARIRGVKP